MKYKNLIELLEDDVLYTPSTIAAMAEASGMLEVSEASDKRLAKQRIRITLGRFSNNHGFPDEGDGMVTVKGQAPTPGWFGWRWKGSLK